MWIFVAKWVQLTAYCSGGGSSKCEFASSLVFFYLSLFDMLPTNYVFQHETEIKIMCCQMVMVSLWQTYEEVGGTQEGYGQRVTKAGGRSTRLAQLCCSGQAAGSREEWVQSCVCIVPGRGLK